MPKLPRKKVGLISCSGEELPEGTVTRRAVRKVLETLRPDDTVTLCLPLFLAGGEGERAFARHYPTIAVDGCAKRCAALATEKYSARPALSIVVNEIEEAGGEDIGSARRLSEAGKALAEIVAERIAAEADRLLKKRHRPATGEAVGRSPVCSCVSELPAGTVTILGRTARIMGLHLILAQFRDQGKDPDEKTALALLEAVKIYNEVPKTQEKAWREALLREYARFLKEVR